MPDHAGVSGDRAGTAAGRAGLRLGFGIWHDWHLLWVALAFVMLALTTTGCIEVLRHRAPAPG
jgi:hypothetical protein